MLASDPTNQPQPGAPRAKGSPAPHSAETSSLPPSPTPAVLPKMPRRIGNYIILERLGRGGYGDVYLGRHRWLGVPAAIKVVRDPVPRRGFVREARRLYKLRGHPGIPELREFGFFRPSPGAEPLSYFASDPVPSSPAPNAEDDPGTLTGHARSRNLDLAQRLDLFARVCDAVQHAHANGVIHLDLKPSNILVAPGVADRPAQPKIIDFGVARAADPARELLARGVQGTVPYMSPEQTVRGAPLDARSDVYSLGVVLYELLCGTLPYEVPESAEAAARVIREVAPDWSGARAAAVPHAVREVVARALNKDPGARHATAGALGSDVRAVLSGRRPARPSGSAVRRLWLAAAEATGLHPYIGVAVIVAASAALTQIVAVPVLYSWTDATARFEAAFVRPLAAAPLRDVVIVPRTVESDAALGVSTERPYREACAGVLDALVAAEPAAVVLDHFYESGDGVPEAATRRLAAAASHLVSRGCPVVVGLEHRERTRGGQGVPVDGALDPALRPALSGWGFVGFRNPIGGKGEWGVNVLIQDASGFTPSLALAAVVAAYAPGDGPEFWMDRTGSVVRVTFRHRGDGQVQPDLDPGKEMLLPVSFVGHLDADEGGTPGGARVNELVAVTDVPLSDERAFEQVELSMAKLARGDAAELARARGKFVVVCEGRPNMDMHRNGPESRHGSRVHAALIQMLWARAAVRKPSLWQEYAIPVGGALAGVVAVGPVARRRSWWPRHAALGFALVWGALVLSVVAAGIAAAFWFSYVCNPLVVVFAMVVSAGMALALIRCRRGRFTPVEALS